MKSTGAVLLVGLAAACARAGIETPEVPAAAVAAAANQFLQTDLRPAGSGSARGSVELFDLPATDDTEIQLEATGLPPGPHAWHIHSGGCASSGPVVVPFGESVEVGQDGHAQEDARIPAARLTRQQIESAAYSLNIHAGSGASAGAPIACAEL